MTRAFQRCFHCIHSSSEALIQSGLTERTTCYYILNAGSVITWNVLGNHLFNYICSPRNSAEITGMALDRSDFRLFPIAGNDFSVSFHFLAQLMGQL